MKFRIHYSNTFDFRSKECPKEGMISGSPDYDEDPIWYPPGSVVVKGEKYYDDEIAYLEINTLEELLALKEYFGERLIVGNHWETKEPAIEVYNGYRE